MIHYVYLKSNSTIYNPQIFRAQQQCIIIAALKSELTQAHSCLSGIGPKKLNNLPDPSIQCRTKLEKLLLESNSIADSSSAPARMRELTKPNGCLGLSASQPRLSQIRSLSSSCAFDISVQPNSLTMNCKANIKTQKSERKLLSVSAIVTLSYCPLLPLQLSGLGKSLNVQFLCCGSL